MSRTGPTRRLGLGRQLGLVGVAAAVVPVAAGMVPRAAAGARAAALSPGPVTIQMSGSITSASFNISGITGTAAGTVDAAGNFTIPAAGVSLNPVAITLIIPVTLHPSASSGWSGSIDPVTGAMTLHGPVTIDIPISLVSADCTLGPIALSPSSGGPGGAPLDFATGVATLADNAFAIPNLTVSPTCPAAIVSAAASIAGLPISPGGATARFTDTVTFAPPPPTTTTTTAPAPSPGPSLTLSSTTVAQGGQLTVAGAGFEPGSQATLTLASTPVSLGTARADSGGRFTATPVIPSDTPPGTHTLTAAGTGASGSPLSLSAALTVVAALPATGSSVDGPLLAVAAAAVLLGAALVAAGSRRRRSERAP